MDGPFFGFASCGKINIAGIKQMFAGSGGQMMSDSIEVVPFRENWADDYRRESAQIVNNLHPLLTSIDHIGGTSIPNMASQPIIDILGGISSFDMLDQVSGRMRRIGYHRPDEKDAANHLSFIKEDLHGDHLVHLYLYDSQTEDAVHFLAFRDYLKTHEDDASLYGQIKINLAKAFPLDAESYSTAKIAAVKKIEARALQWWYEQ